MRYRKLPGRLHEWHNHPLCPDWPTYGFIEHEGVPEDDICTICVSMHSLEAEMESARESDGNKK